MGKLKSVNGVSTFASKKSANDGPTWLIRDQAADGSPRWYVRLPCSTHQIGEPEYFGPFLHEATARKFETKAYNLLMEAVSQCRDISDELHELELQQSDGEPAWMLGDAPRPRAGH